MLQMYLNICNAEKPCGVGVVTDVTDVTDSSIPVIINYSRYGILRPLKTNNINIKGVHLLHLKR